MQAPDLYPRMLNLCRLCWEDGRDFQQPQCRALQKGGFSSLHSPGVGCLALSLPWFFPWASQAAFLSPWRGGWSGHAARTWAFVLPGPAAGHGETGGRYHLSWLLSNDRLFC